MKAERKSNCGATIPAWRLRLIAKHLQVGGLIAYPTEGVWGLGCLPLNTTGLQALCSVKKRSAAKGFVVIAADLAQLLPLIALEPNALAARVADTWPGPVNWVLPASDLTPSALTGGRRTIACRVTAHPLASALCRALDTPLVSTSCNFAGHPPARTRAAVVRFARSGNVLVIPGELGAQSGPCPIFDGGTGARLR